MHENGSQHRHAMRLQGYDYGQAGAYFVTICTQGRECLLGEVTPAGEMALNQAGRMVERWWQELGAKFPHVVTDAFVVMPNHVHGIIVITDGGAHMARDGQIVRGGHIGGRGGHIVRGGHIGPPLPPMGDAPPDGDVGADLRVGPGGAAADMVRGGQPVRGGHIGPPLPPVGDTPSDGDASPDGDVGDAAPMGDAPPDGDVPVGAPLPEIMQWFKTMTTNAYIRGVHAEGWPAFPGKLWQRSYYDHIIRDEAALDRIRCYMEDNPLRWAFDRENPMACPAEQLCEHTRTEVSPPTPAWGGGTDTP